MDLNGKHRVVWIISGTVMGFLFVLTLATGPWNTGHTSTPPPAVDGVLDLRTWDFATDGVVPMRGEWIFAGDFGRRVRSVPDTWSGQGYGSYHLTVLLPTGAPPLALRVQTMATALEVRVNGESVARAGNPSPDPALAVAAYKPQVVAVPSHGVEGELVFTVAVSNWKYRAGGMWESLQLGERQTMFDIKQRLDGSAYLLYVFFLCIAGIGITVFLLRRKETTFLVFGLFCVSMALRVFSTGEYLIARRFPGLSFETVIRLEYLSFLLAVPLGFLFFFSQYPYIAGNRLKMVLIAPYALFLMTLPFLPLPVLTGSIFLLYALIFSGLFIVGLLLLIRVLPREKTEGAVVVAGGITLGIATVNDSLHSSYIIQSANIAPFVFAVFIGVLAVVLARRLLIGFGQAELLGEELSISNARLSRELENTLAARAALEDALKDRETLIHEIHHRVKNSLQTVASIISLQTRRITDTETRSMFQKLNLRIRSISLVHEKLYDLSSVTRIEISRYIRELVQMLETAYAPENARVNLTLPPKTLIASLEFCVDLGLMLNELVSNAFKHGAFGYGDQSGTCLVSVDRRGTALDISVQNPLRRGSSTFGTDAAEGLGFKILRTVLKRSGGTITTAEVAGMAVVTLNIPWKDSA